MHLRRIFPALFLCLVLAPQAEARPVSAVLYPSGALVTEEKAVMPTNGAVTLHIPAGAEENSLSVNLSSGSIVSRKTDLLRGTPSPAVKMLQRERNALREKMDRTRAELEGIRAMRNFWTQPPYSISAPSVELANRLMDTFSKESQGKLDELADREARLRAELSDMETRFSALDSRIKALGPDNLAVRECVLTVRNTESGPVTARFSYWLNDARWMPQYRIAADSVTGRVSLRMDAAITQTSGMDWKNVELSLVSSDRLHSVTPPSLPQWILGETTAPRVNAMLKSARSADFAVANAPASQDAAGMNWSLGRTDVPASGTVTRLVALHELDADFSRLARPRQSRDVWMYAALADKALANAPHLPAGQASFLVDGRETVRGTFRFSPSDREIFFGVDQLMAVTMHETAAANDADIKPASAKERTLNWNWKAVIKNGHDRPVALRVEEAAPIARDASIGISVTTAPEARLDADRARWVWTLDIPAQGQSEVSFDVKAVMPEKKD